MDHETRLCSSCGDVFEAGRVTKKCCQNAHRAAKARKNRIAAGKVAAAEKAQRERALTEADPTRPSKQKKESRQLVRGLCTICGKEFKKHGLQRACSRPCRKKHKYAVARGKISKHPRGGKI